MPRDGTATRERILETAHRIVLERGFAATSVDAVLAAAPATKGAFFHHFPTKDDLGHALLERYAANDAQILEDFMAAAETESDDPAEQLVMFIRHFEHAAADLGPATRSGCLFASFVYESGLGAGEDGLIAASIRHWRTRLLEKIEAAAALHPPAIAVDLGSLADKAFTTFEGGFVLARAMQDPDALRAQLTHLRNYFELLFQVSPDEPARLAAPAALART